MENKNIRVIKTTLRDQGKETDLKDTTPSERFAMVWQLTKNAWAFMGEPIDQSGSQRQIERVLRRGR